MLKGVHDKYVTLVIRSRTNKQDVPNLDGHTQGTLGCVIAGNSSNGGGGCAVVIVVIMLIVFVVIVLVVVVLIHHGCDQRYHP